MKILYLSIAFPKDSNNLYTDLAEEIAKNNEITIVATEERKNTCKTQFTKERGIDVLRVKVGNMYNVNLIEKAITYITMQYKIKRGINKFLKDKEYDLIVFMSPPVTIGKVVKYAMKKYKAKSYLMQKDIFPQNSVDLGLINKNSLIYKYFRKKEKQIYKYSSIIGCMSQGNIEYLINNNTEIDKNKLELFPNTIKIYDNDKEIVEEDIRKKYNIPNDSVIALYGGNFGKPQGIDFITKVLELYKNDFKVTFILIGKGTEKNKLYEYINCNKINNVIALDFIPKNEYNQILKQADIGLIFLDYRFTIPNIPSRSLSYFEYSIPIMAATDKNTDYKEFIETPKVGQWSYSGDIKEFKEKFDFMISNKEIREKMGKNGRKYLEENFTVTNSIQILENAYNKLRKEVN